MVILSIHCNKNMQHRVIFKDSMGSKRCHLPFETLFDWFGRQICTQEVSKPSGRNPPPPLYRSIKKPTLIRVNPILHHSNPRVVSMSDFCTLLAWPHFFPRLPWNFLMLLKQPHLRALSNGCTVSSCLASLCFKSRDKCLWAELVTSSNGVE